MGLSETASSCNWQEKLAETGTLLEPGTPEFQQAFALRYTSVNDPDLEYRFSLSEITHKFIMVMQITILEIKIKFAEIQVGGSYRTYRLNSFRNHIC